MALTYKALALLLRYPDGDVQQLAQDAAAALDAEALIPRATRRALAKLASEIAGGDLFDLQERYVDLFDRTRSLSLNLYEHVHGESRDRGQAMVGLLELYRSRGLELSARELPDYLPVFLEFLSALPATEAASLLGESAHVVAAIGERLQRRASPYQAVFAALGALASAAPDEQALTALLQEPGEDPGDLEALDRLWAETAVTFGPSDVGCPKASAIVDAMNTSPAPVRRRARMAG